MKNNSISSSSNFLRFAPPPDLLENQRKSIQYFFEFGISRELEIFRPNGSLHSSVSFQSRGVAMNPNRELSTNLDRGSRIDGTKNASLSFSRALFERTHHNRKTVRILSHISATEQAPKPTGKIEAQAEMKTKRNFFDKNFDSSVSAFPSLGVYNFFPLSENHIASGLKQNIDEKNSSGLGYLAQPQNTSARIFGDKKFSFRKLYLALIDARDEKFKLSKEHSNSFEQGHKPYHVAEPVSKADGKVRFQDQTRNKRGNFIINESRKEQNKNFVGRRRINQNSLLGFHAWDASVLSPIGQSTQSHEVLIFRKNKNVFPLFSPDLSEFISHNYWVSFIANLDSKLSIRKKTLSDESFSLYPSIASSEFDSKLGRKLSLKNFQKNTSQIKRGKASVLADPTQRSRKKISQLKLTETDNQPEVGHLIEPSGIWVEIEDKKQENQIELGLSRGFAGAKHEFPHFTNSKWISNYWPDLHSFQPSLKTVQAYKFKLKTQSLSLAEPMVGVKWVNFKLRKWVAYKIRQKNFDTASFSFDLGLAGSDSSEVTEEESNLKQIKQSNEWNSGKQISGRNAKLANVTQSNATQVPPKFKTVFPLGFDQTGFRWIWQSPCLNWSRNILVFSKFQTSVLNTLSSGLSETPFPTLLNCTSLLQGEISWNRALPQRQGLMNETQTRYSSLDFPMNMSSASLGAPVQEVDFKSKPQRKLVSDKSNFVSVISRVSDVDQFQSPPATAQTPKPTPKLKPEFQFVFNFGDLTNSSRLASLPHDSFESSYQFSPRITADLNHFRALSGSMEKKTLSIGMYIKWINPIQTNDQHKIGEFCASPASLGQAILSVLQNSTKRKSSGLNLGLFPSFAEFPSLARGREPYVVAMAKPTPMQTSKPHHKADAKIKKNKTAQPSSYGGAFPILANDIESYFTQAYAPTWVYLGEIPLISNRGSFLVNGTTKVLVNQITRCPNCYFKLKLDSQNRRTYQASFLSDYGSWLRFETDKTLERIWVRIDKSARFPLEFFLQSLCGEFSSLFGSFTATMPKLFSISTRKRLGEKSASLISLSLTASPRSIEAQNSYSPIAGIRSFTRSEDMRSVRIFSNRRASELGVQTIWKKCNPGRFSSTEGLSAQARWYEFFGNKFFNPKKYSLSSEGRKRLNRRLGRAPSQSKKVVENTNFGKGVLSFDQSKGMISNLISNSSQVLSSPSFKTSEQQKIENNTSTECLIPTLTPEDILSALKILSGLAHSETTDSLSYHVETGLDRMLKRRLNFEAQTETPGILNINALASAPTLVRRLRDSQARIKRKQDFEKQNTLYLDDIDHFQNRRVRLPGSILLNQFRLALSRAFKTKIQYSPTTSGEAYTRKTLALTDSGSIAAESDRAAFQGGIPSSQAFGSTLRELFGTSQLSQYMDETNPLAEITHKRRLTSLGPGGVGRESAGFAVREIHPSHFGRICPIETPEGQNAGLVGSLAMYASIDGDGKILTPVTPLISPLGVSLLNQSCYGYDEACAYESKKFFSSTPIQPSLPHGRLSNKGKLGKFGIYGNSILKMPFPASAFSLRLGALPSAPPYQLRSEKSNTEGKTAVPRQIGIPRNIYYLNAESFDSVRICGADSGEALESIILDFVNEKQVEVLRVGSAIARDPSVLPSLQPLNASPATGTVQARNQSIGLSKNIYGRAMASPTQAPNRKLIHWPEQAHELLNNISFAEVVQFKQEFQKLSPLQIDFRGICCVQMISVATSLIPFLEHDDANRALMGSNMQRQAVPLVQPTKSLVGTGFELQAARDASFLQLAEFSGQIQKIDSRSIEILSLGGFQCKRTKPTLEAYPSHNRNGKYRSIEFSHNLQSNQGTYISERPPSFLNIGDFIEKGDLLADNSSTHDGELALGKNLLTGYLAWEGYNFEDAIVISERLVTNDLYTSIHISCYEFDCRNLLPLNSEFGSTFESPALFPVSNQFVDSYSALEVVSSQTSSSENFSKPLQAPNPHESDLAQVSSIGKDLNSPDLFNSLAILAPALRKRANLKEDVHGGPAIAKIEDSISNPKDSSRVGFAIAESEPVKQRELGRKRGGGDTNPKRVQNFNQTSVLLQREYSYGNTDARQAQNSKTHLFSSDIFSNSFGSPSERSTSTKSGGTKRTEETVSRVGFAIGEPTLIEAQTSGSAFVCKLRNSLTEKFNEVDSDGIIKLGSWVKPGSILIQKLKFTQQTRLALQNWLRKINLRSSKLDRSIEFGSKISSSGIEQSKEVFGSQSKIDPKTVVNSAGLRLGPLEDNQSKLLTSVGFVKAGPSQMSNLMEPKLGIASSSGLKASSRPSKSRKVDRNIRAEYALLRAILARRSEILPTSLPSRAKSSEKFSKDLETGEGEIQLNTTFPLGSPGQKTDLPSLRAKQSNIGKEKSQYLWRSRAQAQDDLVQARGAIPETPQTRSTAIDDVLRVKIGSGASPDLVNKEINNTETAQAQELATQARNTREENEFALLTELHSVIKNNSQNTNVTAGADFWGRVFKRNIPWTSSGFADTSANSLEFGWIRNSPKIPDKSGMEVSERKAEAKPTFSEERGETGEILKPHHQAKYEQRSMVKSTAIQIYVAHTKRIQIGDKMSGRHGNKGIVSLILPPQDMPYIQDGTPLDIVLNPLGVPSRMNVGQVLETLLGLAANYSGWIYRVIPFVPQTFDMQILKKSTANDSYKNYLGQDSNIGIAEMNSHETDLAGSRLSTKNSFHLPFDAQRKRGTPIEISQSLKGQLRPETARSLVYSRLWETSQLTGLLWLFDPNNPGKQHIFDGRTGDVFDQPVLVGYSYIFKLNHLVDDKIHARSVGPYSAVTQQPLGGRSKLGGQRLGEMEVWACEGFGASYLLQEFLTTKSDSIELRNSFLFQLIRRQNLPFRTRFNPSMTSKSGSESLVMTKPMREAKWKALSELKMSFDRGILLNPALGSPTQGQNKDTSSPVQFSVSASLQASLNIQRKSSYDNYPESFRVLVAELQSLCLNLYSNPDFRLSYPSLQNIQ